MVLVQDQLAESLDSQGLEATTVSVEQVDPRLIEFETSFGENDLVRIIGQHSLLERRQSDEAEREHHLVHLNVGGFRQTVWVTEPAPGQTLKATVATKPGLGEIIEDGIGWDFHRELAHELPAARILSHATYGFGPTAERIPFHRLPGHNLGRLSLMGIDLLSVIPDDSPLVLAGTSLGTIINHGILRANLERPDPLKVDLVVHHAPALVDPSRVIPDMVVGFPPNMAGSIFGELTLNSDPSRFKDNILALWRSKPGIRDILPTGRLILDILKGTRKEEVEEVVAGYDRTEVIEGRKDSIAEIEMWEELAQKYPQSLGLHLLNGHGHGVAIIPKQKAHKIAKVIKTSGIY